MGLGNKFGFLLKSINYANHKISNKIDKTILNIENSPRLLTLSKDERILIKKNTVFYNCHKGKRCFIIGNGPSLIYQDLTPLAGEKTFVMNSFWKHSIIDNWQPTYYFLGDLLYFDGSKLMKDFFTEMNDNIKKSEFFVPLSGKNSIQQDLLLPTDRIHYVAFNRTLAQDPIKKIDFTQPIPFCQSVSQFAIMAAMYMGCSPIYLMGLDHNWLAHLGQDQHFYQGNDFDSHPLIENDLSKQSYKLSLENMLELWNGYETIKRIAERNNIKIFNATDGGFLDVFPRIGYESLFNQ